MSDDLKKGGLAALAALAVLAVGGMIGNGTIDVFGARSGPAQVGDQVYFSGNVETCYSEQGFSGEPGSREFFCQGGINRGTYGTIEKIGEKSGSHYCIDIDGGKSVCRWVYRDRFTVTSKGAKQKL